MAVHVFTIDDVRIAVDGNSGAVHVLDRVAYDLLRYIIKTGDWKPVHLEGYAEEEVREAFSEMSRLREEGMLFSPPVDKDRLPSPEGPYYVKALCLNVSHDCNLSCEYCFAGKGSFGGERLQMPVEVAHKAVDFLLTASGDYPKVEIDFFGGEPLMNLPVVKDTVDYGKKRASQTGKGISFTITTNGVGLNEEVIEFLNESMYNVVLSLDGRREVTDRMRRFPVGGGKRSTYDFVTPRLLAMARARGERLHYVRGTYTAFNLDFAEDVRHLADLGFKSISVEPVVAGGEDYALRENHLPALFAEYERLARFYVQRVKAGRSFDFFHFNIELDNPPCLDKRLSGCGAGHEYLAVDPYGDIYPCHQFVGKASFRMGSVFEKPDGAYDRLAKTFKSAHVENKVACCDCWAKLYCGGGCHANAVLRTGELLQPDPVACRLQQKRLECALYAKALLLSEE